MGALRSLQQGLALLRAIAQSEAVRDARNRVLERIGEQTTRLVQSGLVPKAMTAPAELLAEYLAKRPPAATDPSLEPDVEHDTAAPEVVEMSTPAPHAAQAEPTSTDTQSAEGRKPKRAAGAKRSAKREASGASAPARKRSASAATAKKPVRRTKKVRDKAEPLK